jgi:hypothetical protein
MSPAPSASLSGLWLLDQPWIEAEQGGLLGLYPAPFPTDVVCLDRLSLSLARQALPAGEGSGRTLHALRPGQHAMEDLATVILDLQADYIHVAFGVCEWQPQAVSVLAGLAAKKELDIASFTCLLRIDGARRHRFRDYERGAMLGLPRGGDLNTDVEGHIVSRRLLVDLLPLLLRLPLRPHWWRLALGAAAARRNILHLPLPCCSLRPARIFTATAMEAGAAGAFEQLALPLLRPERPVDSGLLREQLLAFRCAADLPPANAAWFRARLGMALQASLRELIADAQQHGPLRALGAVHDSFDAPLLDHLDAGPAAVTGELGAAMALGCLLAASPEEASLRQAVLEGVGCREAGSGGEAAALAPLLARLREAEAAADAWRVNAAAMRDALYIAREKLRGTNGGSG